MKQLLKTPVSFKCHFRNKDYVYKAKTTLVFNLDDEEEDALYRYIKETFDFCYPIKRQEVNA